MEGPKPKVLSGAPRGWDVERGAVATRRPGGYAARKKIKNQL